jgi:hypothetical protein
MARENSCRAFAAMMEWITLCSLKKDGSVSARLRAVVSGWQTFVGVHPNSLKSAEN